MAARRYPVIGGPADGLELSYRPSVYVWIDAEGRRTGVPRPGAEMYQKNGRNYVHVHNQWRVCECGAHINRRADHCPLCGSPTV